MKRSFKALLTVALVAVPLLTSCSEARDPMSAPSVTPQSGLITDVMGGLIRTVGVILTGPDANGSVASVWIGPQGGTLKTAAYTLTIPANAVTVNTRFDLEPLNNGQYNVELHAYQQGLLGLGLLDVGAKGFRKPVSLTFSYANAVGVENPRHLIIVYIKPDGSQEKQNCDLDSRKESITSQLSHFSKYAMAEN